MTAPDTTEAVRRAITANSGGDIRPAHVVLAEVAIAADRKALEEQGYAIVPLDDVAKARAYEAALNRVGTELSEPYEDDPYEQGVEMAWRDISQLLKEERVLARRRLGPVKGEE